MTEALQTSTPRSFDSGQDNNRYSPSLIVIILMRSPLEQGPWLEQLEFGSIQIDAPDQVYLLDPSLLQPGHFDVLAAQIRKLQLEGDPLDMGSDVVLTLPPSLTGADLSAIRKCRVINPFLPNPDFNVFLTRDMG